MRIHLLIVFLMLIVSCASNQPHQQGETSSEAVVDSESAALGKAENFSSKSRVPQVYEREVGFANTPQTELYQSSGGVIRSQDINQYYSKAEAVKSLGEGVSDSNSKQYTLQFEVVSDVDVAQKRRWAVTQKTGLGAYLLFDSPFYKIRAGKWDNKNDAEDAALQFNAMGISAIIIEL